MRGSDHLETIQELADRINRPIRIMEVCGTHTMTAFRSGLRSLLPGNIKLLSGPGCPVCVTPGEFIDRAIAISQLTGVSIATFGDLVRVRGTESSLELERAKGAKVRVVYSAGDALLQAEQNREQTVVFLGIGFETTIPTVAWTIKKAAAKNISNFLVLCAHKTMPQAMAGLLGGEEIRIDGFLCPGHVSAIIGSRPYEFICQDHHIPCVVAGFEPMDMVIAIEMLLKQLVENRAQVENEYTRGVSEQGNLNAQALIREVFEESDAEWRGLGTIPGSGLSIRDAFRAHDAEPAYAELDLPKPAGQSQCICGDILRGTRTPPECPLFRTSCTPATPAGACMVSSEGTCAAYYKYGGFGR
ncbi:hydrogenase formation protein HypD [Verrucomicrobiota bacterium]